MMSDCDFLKQAEEELNTQVQNLRNQSNESLEYGANYSFVLCNAKISFINSLLRDVQFARSNHVPDVVVKSTINAVKHVEENFKTFLCQCC